MLTGMLTQELFLVHRNVPLGFKVPYLMAVREGSIYLPMSPKERNTNDKISWYYNKG